MHQLSRAGAREVTAVANTRNKEPDARERIPSQQGHQNKQRGSLWRFTGADIKDYVMQ